MIRNGIILYAGGGDKLKRDEGLSGRRRGNQSYFVTDELCH